MCVYIGPSDSRSNDQGHCLLPEAVQVHCLSLNTSLHGTSTSSSSFSVYFLATMLLNRPVLHVLNDRIG